MKKEACRKQGKHRTKKWEISLIELQNALGKKFKVTRRLSDVSVAETKFFSSKKKAKKQFDDWLK
ncbi:hypothetical protein HY772_02700 [Candidatus Woesearchaeota archaeon]|nr:hypothetical protein [Candidatus Woesearchaeota archaeon]